MPKKEERVKNWICDCPEGLILPVEQKICGYCLATHAFRESGTGICIGCGKAISAYAKRCHKCHGINMRVMQESIN